MPVRYNKTLIPLLSLLNNCISVISTPQILSIKGECIFLLLSFLIIGLCNSSANSLLAIFLFLITLAKALYQKIYQSWQ